MKNYDPYKRIILFLASCINICMMSLMFAWFWYNYYADTMFVVNFHRRGNYVMIAFYAMILLFFSKTYGGLKIGRDKGIEVMLSGCLSIVVSNFFEYIIISLLAFKFVNALGIVALSFLEMLISFVWYMPVSAIYNRLFQPWKMLLIYGDDDCSADMLRDKISTRKDKYIIYDTISINEDSDKIKEKLNKYQAVVLGDISAVRRNDLLKYCYANHIRAYIVPKLSDIILMGGDRVYVFDTPFVLSKGYTLSFDRRIAKRLMDILLGILLFIITLPVMIITALIIKFSDGGSVFYKQTRITENDKEFDIIKFRSMRPDAESDGIARLASKDDERITKVGKVIRATRIDELPQIINIIKGEMSFVGPRPERPELVKEMVKTMPEYAYRTRVKAGLTGLAQVYGKYNTRPYDKLKFDLLYLENYSLWLDVKLMLMTLKTLFKKSSSEGID